MNTPIEFTAHPEWQFSPAEGTDAVARHEWKWTGEVSLNLAYVISAQACKIGDLDATDVRVEGGNNIIVRLDYAGFKILWRAALEGAVKP